MNLIALPAFTDNHIWTLDDGHTPSSSIPRDSAPVSAAPGERPLVLAAILVTHHNADRVGCVAMKNEFL